MYKEAKLNPLEEVSASHFARNYIITSRWPYYDIKFIRTKWSGIFKDRSAQKDYSSMDLVRDWMS